MVKLGRKAATHGALTLQVLITLHRMSFLKSVKKGLESGKYRLPENSLRYFATFNKIHCGLTARVRQLLDPRICPVNF